MSEQAIGILHPGNMGTSLAATARHGGHAVYWASEGRSPATRQRAEEYGLRDAGSVANLCAVCSAVVSVCPPAAAEDVARLVAGCGFRGLYLDANAISPQRAQQVGAILTGAGARFVDGGIIGFPAWKPGTTWLYLSGEHAAEAAAWFAAGPLATEVLGPTVGQASALKMCYAALTKGTTALLCAVLAAAEGLGVRDALCAQWARGGSDLADRREQEVRGVTAKAWRFEGEMREIASTLAAAGLPGEFHQAAAEVYARLAGFRDSAEPPQLGAVLGALLGPAQTGEA